MDRNVVQRCACASNPQLSRPQYVANSMAAMIRKADDITANTFAASKHTCLNLRIGPLLRRNPHPAPPASKTGRQLDKVVFDLQHS